MSRLGVLILKMEKVRFCKVSVLHICTKNENRQLRVLTPVQKANGPLPGKTPDTRLTFHPMCRFIVFQQSEVIRPRVAYLTRG